ncbi:MAG: DUF4118 domain-containing protein [Bacillota bacterium]|nr:DUF4118 domain-containing protein [Bacillota bacterium]
MVFRTLNLKKGSGKLLRNILAYALIMAVCTLVSILLRHIGAIESNIVMVYLLGILLFSYLASGYIYSFAASVCGVLLYNFFFTEPYFTLRAYSPDYPITFFVMFVVGFFTSMLTIRIKRETMLSEEREERIKSLYFIGKRLLGIKSETNLAEVSAGEIGDQFSADVLVQFFDPGGNVRDRYTVGTDIFSEDKERVAALEACRSGSPCGCGTKLFSEGKAYYLPVIGQSGVLGVIGVSLHGQGAPSSAQREFLDAIAPQIAVVLERERLYEKQEETQIQIQRERLRSDMLRTISHDFRTPLTGIMGSASTILDNYDTVSDSIKKNFLQNIYEDAGWLNELVENILNMTRFEEGKIKLNLEEEAAEEIVAEAVAHVKKRANGHRITAKLPENIVLLRADGVLLRQVLVNLLGNAVNYTPEGSEITVTLFRENGRVVFEVSDDGPGISQDDLPHMFERFYSRRDKAYGPGHGAGLGLSLCKSIVEAHGGVITIENRKPHGTVVRFSVLTKEEPPYAAPDTDR